jgi:hypothetical protein
MSPRLTDQAVSELPLTAARAELLEEIMATPVVERPTVHHEAGPRRGRRWAATIAAAAAAAALVAVPSWLLSRDEPSAVFAGAPAHDWVVLDAPGWDVTHISDPLEGGSEVEWANGEATLNVHLYPADLRDSYVEDRERIDYPRVDRGAPVELLGQPARMWHYSARDHTAIGAVDGAVYPEVRAQGMDEAAYRTLLTQLAWTDEAEFEFTLPEQFVTSGEADATIAAMLRGIPLAPGAEVPSSGENDSYHLGADVARQVVCPWIAEFERAREAGDSRAVEDAQRALADSRRWAFLDAMNAEGDYPEVVWEISADVVAGRVPPEYEQGLGCY